MQILTYVQIHKRFGFGVHCIRHQTPQSRREISRKSTGLIRPQTEVLHHQQDTIRRGVAQTAYYEAAVAGSSSGGNRSPIQYRARLRAGFDRCGKLFVLYTQYAVEWGNSRNDKHGFRSQNRTAEASGTGRYDVGI